MKAVFNSEETRRIMQSLRLGDKVAAVTSAVGIKPCGGCKKRQAWLNGEANKFPDPLENRATLAKSEEQEHGNNESGL